MVVSLLLALALAAGDMSAAPGGDKSEKSADARDTMICKKFLETGSLVKGKRVCKTKAEWDHERDNMRAGYNTAAACQVAEGGSCGF
ncbi:hypothetical protein HL653_19545 [Sphingomonas sp. AP4-R1]|uniref:hypothetical protein n=1 Tax=Sphingomonas sp. AP4-R1 TaxID=2735134 RepID=UPI0014936825|nr:hypothetical protein [Sphingomonas sp. AP4-R1]QJU59655.1 hypothetical protein HL653_19545 [Sphingomonas sp. AP4-R1]